MKSKIVILIFLFWSWNSGVSAQEPLIGTFNDSDVQEWTLEEIVVIGQKSLFSQKMEMVELGTKHPSLAKAMINEYELKQRYIVERREKFKDSILIGHPGPEEYFGDELIFLKAIHNL